MTARERMVAIVNAYVGCSAKVRSTELAELCGRNVDAVANVCTWMNAPKFSNCAFFALGVWAKAGVKHHVLTQPYRVGLAIAWTILIGNDTHAVKKPHRDGLPKAGDLMMYFSNQHNHHVEFCLSDASAKGIADHAGGGRADCAISSGRSLITWSNGRPLQYWFDAESLLDSETAEPLDPTV